MSDAPRVAVVTFPGSNDDEDARLALDTLGAEAVAVWHADEALPEGTAGVVLPGGFSYGDYLRCGALARFAPVVGAVRAFADEGGPVLGICNGFQILCEAGLLPGVLRPNRDGHFLCRDVAVRVESDATPFTARCAPGEILEIPVKHGEGAWFADQATVMRLQAEGRIVLRYLEDVNGAVERIAGVANERGNVFGLMPHPEHAVDPLLGPVGGRPLLEGLLDAARAYRDRAVALV
ncbi:MAG: phosphoribosylformylglycinamidine synthase subunit PurQ [Thermoleophilia bacterium]|nr:phosphoribosylformylglycinamidine synthase subunit PurQ [Thermoleophilia bacterium]